MQLVISKEVVERVFEDLLGVRDSLLELENMIHSNLGWELGIKEDYNRHFGSIFGSDIKDLTVDGNIYFVYKLGNEEDDDALDVVFRVLEDNEDELEIEAVIEYYRWI